MTDLSPEERMILHELAAGVASPAELASALDTDREAVLGPLADLRERGLVERQPAGYGLTRQGESQGGAETTPAVAPFETHTDRYDAWFEEHRAAYVSELAALQELLPVASPGVEIGVGTGRFAEPLGVEYGVDPSPAMLGRARKRGVTPLRGVAEALPLRTDTMALAVFVTTVCFVDDLDQALREARRILRPGGTLLVGFIARDSPLGRVYREKREENPFYKDATFESVSDLLDSLSAAGFCEPRMAQTLFSDPQELAGPDRVESGWGEGSFVVVAARVPVAESQRRG